MLWIVTLHFRMSTLSNETLLYNVGIEIEKEITYSFHLNTMYQTLEGNIAVLKGIDEHTNMTLQFYGDGALLFEQHNIMKGSTIPFHLVVSNVNELTIKVTNYGESNGYLYLSETKLK